MKKEQPSDQLFRSATNTILEAKIGDDLKRIGTANRRPDFNIESKLILDRLIIFSDPEFFLQPVPIEEWLKKKTLVVTTIKATQTCHSTSSWICMFDDCESSYRMPECDMTIMKGAVFTMP